MKTRIGMRGVFSAACLVCLLFAMGPSVGTISVSICQAGPVEHDLWDLEGPGDLGWEMADWTMKYVNPASPPSGWSSATLLPYAVPEYHWWNGCSPTAAGMLFAYWDTHLGKKNLYTFHDGNSAYWDRTNMNMSREADYGRNGVAPSRATHSIVASWEHRQAGVAKGLTYGSWDRNGNGIVDASDRAQWNCLADFMRTENGGTSRSRMAQGFIDFAAWDDPTTPVSEAYYATASTKTSTRKWTEYMSEINNGYPVHVGISGHSILGVGFWTDPNGIYGAPGTQYVVNKTTWGGGSADKYGLIEYSEVYAYTLLRIGDSVVPINDPPIANHDFYSLNEDEPLIVYAHEGVLVNDIDPEGVALEAILLSNPSHGILDFGALGWFTYTPNRDYHGTDSFTYRAFDGVNYSNPATVHLAIASVNDPPIAVDDFYSTDMGTSLIRYAHNGVLANDTDPDNTDHDPTVQDTLTAHLQAGPSHGSLSFGVTGWFTYTPGAEFQGTDSFTYKAFDGTDWSDLATVTIQVLGYIVGDANRDGVVDEADMAILAANWGNTGATWQMGDFDGDGKVGPTDAAMLAANWGCSIGQAAEANVAVPEPSSFVFLLIVACGLCFPRGRKP